MTSTTPLALVTGGAGFIGSHTSLALLARGCRVRVLDTLDPQVHGPAANFARRLPDAIECVRGDVRDPETVRRALDGVSYVFHFAALTGVGQSMYDIRRYVDVNLSGTACLIEAIAGGAFPVRRLVLASSRAVYGEGTCGCRACGTVYPSVRRREDLERGIFEIFCPQCGGPTTPAPTAEDRPLTPVSIYGWTKREQEQLVRYAAHVPDLSTVILRYFNVYGSGQSLLNPYTGIVAIFFARLRANEAISVYERGVPVRDFVHVRDVVAANLAALDATVPPGTAINVGSGTGSSIRDIAAALGRASDLAVQYEDHGEFRVGDVHTCVADLGRARAALQYEPRVSLEEGMREFVEWAQREPSMDRYGDSVEELKARRLFGRAAPPTG